MARLPKPYRPFRERFSSYSPVVRLNTLRSRAKARQAPAASAAGSILGLRANPLRPAGATLRLYRGERFNRPPGRADGFTGTRAQLLSERSGKLRRLRKGGVKRNQSWTPNRTLAAKFAAGGEFSGGRRGLGAVYAVDVPLRDIDFSPRIRGVRRNYGTPLPDAVSLDARGGVRAGDTGRDWVAVGMGWANFEVRPARDLPGVKPRIWGTTYGSPGGEVQLVSWDDEGRQNYIRPGGRKYRRARAARGGGA